MFPPDLSDESVIAVWEFLAELSRSFEQLYAVQIRRKLDVVETTSQDDGCVLICKKQYLTEQTEKVDLSLRVRTGEQISQRWDFYCKIPLSYLDCQPASKYVSKMKTILNADPQSKAVKFTNRDSTAALTGMLFTVKIGNIEKRGFLATH